VVLTPPAPPFLNSTFVNVDALRKPLALPTGSRLHVESVGKCAIDVTFAR